MPKSRPAKKKKPDEAGRWREFAAATQKVNIQLQQQLDEPRLGCGRCRQTGLVDHVDPNTGEVWRVLCPECRPMLEAFIDRYLRI